MSVLFRNYNEITSQCNTPWVRVVSANLLLWSLPTIVAVLTWHVNINTGKTSLPTTSIQYPFSADVVYTNNGKTSLPTTMIQYSYSFLAAGKLTPNSTAVVPGTDYRTLSLWLLSTIYQELASYLTIINNSTVALTTVLATSTIYPLVDMLPLLCANRVTTTARVNYWSTAFQLKKAFVWQRAEPWVRTNIARSTYRKKYQVYNSSIGRTESTTAVVLFPGLSE